MPRCAPIAFPYLIALLCVFACRGAGAAEPLLAASPDGRVGIEISLRQQGQDANVPHYSVRFGDQAVVALSRLGIELADGTALGGPCEIVSSEARQVNDDFTQVTGKRRQVSGRAGELVVRLRETAPPRRTWEVVLRAYDDGAAFRYRFPAQEGWDSLAIARERTEFRFRPDDQAYALLLDGFTTSHEGRASPRR